MRNRNPFLYILAALAAAGLHASGQDHVGSGIFTVSEDPVPMTDFNMEVSKEKISPQIWVSEDPVFFAEAEILDKSFDFPEIEIIKHKTVTPEPRIYLGVALAPVSEALRSHLKLRKNSGVLVNHVIEDSPANKAGILKHDVLTHLDDQLLLNQEQLVSLLATYNDGDSVTVHLFREGTQKEIQLILHEKALPPIVPEITRLAPPAPGALELTGRAVKQDFGFDPATPMKDVIAALEKLNNNQDVSVFSHGSADSVDISKNASVVLKSAEGLSASIYQKNGEKYLTLRDRNNSVLFDGPYDETADLSSKVPAEYHDALKLIQNHNMDMFQPARRSESIFSHLFKKEKPAGRNSGVSAKHSISSSASKSRSIQVDDGARIISFNSKDGLNSLKVTTRQGNQDVVLYDGPANNAALGKIPFPHNLVVRKFLQDNGIISPASH